MRATDSARTGGSTHMARSMAVEEQAPKTELRRTSVFMRGCLFVPTTTTFNLRLNKRTSVEGSLGEQFWMSSSFIRRSGKVRVLRQSARPLVTSHSALYSSG